MQPSRPNSALKCVMVKDAVCVFVDKLREESCIADLWGSDVCHCLPRQRTYLAQGREIVIEVKEQRVNMKCSSKVLKAHYQGERPSTPPHPNKKGTGKGKLILNH